MNTVLALHFWISFSTVFTFLPSRIVAGRNYAILVSGSKDFMNIKHSSSVMAIAHVLMRNGFKKKDIIALCGEDCSKSPRNVHKESILVGENGVKIPHPRVDVEDATSNNLLNVLDFNHPKLIDCDSSSNIFVFIVGHGGVDFFKFQNREIFFSYDLFSALNRMSTRVNKLLLILDSCKAGSFLNWTFFRPNIFAAFSCTEFESSYSNHFDDDLGAFFINNFAHEFYKLSNAHRSMKLSKFFRLIKREKLKSTVVFDYNRHVRFSVGDFFYQSYEQPIRLDIEESQ